jgi:hypothetical protein
VPQFARPLTPELREDEASLHQGTTNGVLLLIIRLVLSSPRYKLLLHRLKQNGSPLLRESVQAAIDSLAADDESREVARHLQMAWDSPSLDEKLEVRGLYFMGSPRGGGGWGRAGGQMTELLNLRCGQYGGH